MVGSSDSDLILQLAGKPPTTPATNPDNPIHQKIRISFSLRQQIQVLVRQIKFSVGRILEHLRLTLYQSKSGAQVNSRLDIEYNSIQYIYLCCGHISKKNPVKQKYFGNYLM